MMTISKPIDSLDSFAVYSLQKATNHSAFSTILHNSINKESKTANHIDVFYYLIKL